MIIDPDLLEELYKDAGENRKQKAEEYVKSKKVNITKVIYENSCNFELKSKVKGNSSSIYEVYIKVKDNEIENVSCTCPDYESHLGTCKHILATIMEFAKNSEYLRIFAGIEEKNENANLVNSKNKIQEQNHNFKQLINVFLEESENNKQENHLHNVKLIPIIVMDRFQSKLKMEIKIGETQMYKLKSFPEFFENMLNESEHKYGNKLEFVHTREAFEEASKPLLDYILKYAEIIKYANETASHYGYYGRMLNENSISISNTGLDDLFEIMKGKQILVQSDMGEKQVTFVDDKPEILFNIEEVDKENYKISPNIDIYEYRIFKGKKNSYISYGNKLYRCSKEYEKTVIKLLEVFRTNFVNEIEFSKSDLSELFSMVIPKIKNNIKIDKIQDEEIEKYIPKELYTKVYLDYDKNNYITAEIKFCYDDIEFNPLLANNPDIARDTLKETETLDKFRKTGFMLDVANARLILVNEEKIYYFLTNEIEDYMREFEVLATEQFKNKEIKQPKISNLGVRVENNLLQINLSGIDFEASEIKKIMEKYKLKKKFHRLKDGSFIELNEDDDTLQFLENVSKRNECNL